jgi:hypothetical protein
LSGLLACHASAPDYHAAATHHGTRALPQVRDVIANFDGVVLTGGAALYAPANTAIAGLLHPLLVHVPSAPHDATLSVRICLLVCLLVPSLVGLLVSMLCSFVNLFVCLLFSLFVCLFVCVGMA